MLYDATQHFFLDTLRYHEGNWIQMKTETTNRLHITKMFLKVRDIKNNYTTINPNLYITIYKNKIKAS